MSKEWDLPEQGVVFWLVGNGDSITVAVDADTVVQVDVNHRLAAEEDDDDRVPIIDRLKEVLPLTGEGKPRLASLVITHHDADHCSGFKRLVDEVQVDELWVTLRSFVEDKADGDLTEQGQDVYDEAKRRRQAEAAAASTGGRAAPGDRLIVVGYADVLEYGEWSTFPESLLVVPGNSVAIVNCVDISDHAEFFIHTPFHLDTTNGDRNSSSLGMQVTLHSNGSSTEALLLGDLTYEQIEAFMEISTLSGNQDRLRWDVLLAPHHGSRNAIRYKDDAGTWQDAEALTGFEATMNDGAIVVVSSREFKSQGPEDTDPPHDDAIEAYRTLVGKGLRAFDR